MTRQPQFTTPSASRGYGENEIHFLEHQAQSSQVSDEATASQLSLEKPQLTQQKGRVYAQNKRANLKIQIAENNLELDSSIVPDATQIQQVLKGGVPIKSGMWAGTLSQPVTAESREDKNRINRLTRRLRERDLVTRLSNTQPK